MENTPIHQNSPFRVPTGDKKTILEHFGNASIGGDDISIARMVAPPGWSEPYQTPEFDEYSLMVSGEKTVTTPDMTITLRAGESLLVPRGTRVRYANPFEHPAEYWSVCMPAFTPGRANRDEN
jgi:mannose-6-phosphate isomerase-like protein (cupin superfamily)